MTTRRSSFGLAARSLFWALAFPGVYAGYIPWRFFGLRSVAFDAASPRHWLGVAGMAVGIAFLAVCILEFARSGRGTLSPADPPRALVVRGPYRYVRNPMYVSVTLILLGEIAADRSRGLFLYWAIWFGLVNVFVILYEERALRRQFGEDYRRYCAAVGRWLPRLRPWHA